MGEFLSSPYHTVSVSNAKPLLPCNFFHFLKINIKELVHTIKTLVNATGKYWRKWQDNLTYLCILYTGSINLSGGDDL